MLVNVEDVLLSAALTGAEIGLLKVTILLAAGWLCVGALRRSCAADRYRVWTVAFVCFAALPFISVVGNGWRADLTADSTASIVAADDQTLARMEFIAADSAEPDQRTTPEAGVIPTPLSTMPETGRADSGSNGPLIASLIALLVWAGGFLIVAGGFVRDLIHVALITRTARPLDRLDYGDDRDHASAIRILSSPNVRMPITWGAFRPVIVLPDTAETWSDERMRSVMAHELAHVERHDYLTHVLIRLTCAVYWFNPLVWISARHAVIDREMACDARVVGSGVSEGAYARHLLYLARESISAPAGGLALGAPSTLRRRIVALLEPGSRRTMPSARLSWSIALLLAIVTTVVTAFRPWDPAAQRDYRAELRQAVADLDGRSLRLRTAAAWTLGTLESGAAVDRLGSALTDEEPEVRAMAAWALGEIKRTRSIEPLTEALDDRDALVREMVVRALGEFKQSAPTELLIGMLADEDSGVRAAAVWALGETGSARAVGSVVSTLEDPSPDVRLQAVDVLATMQVESDCRPGRPSCSDDPDEMNGTVRRGLQGVLGDSSPRIRQHAVRALGHVGLDEDLDHLILLLRDNHPGVRFETARVLGEIGDRRAVPALLDVIGDTHPDVRSSIVWALDEIRIH